MFVVIANQVDGEFETHFRKFVESVGGPEQGPLCCFADGTNQSLVIVCTQAIHNGAHTDTYRFINRDLKETRRFANRVDEDPIRF